MALSGKFIAYVEISKNGDVFHDLFRHNPHEIVAIIPDKFKIVSCMRVIEGPLDQSSLGTIPKKDGKKKVAKEIIEYVNVENHMIVFKVIGGELVEIYKSFIITLHVEPKADGKVATWTLEFEKLDTSVLYPTRFMDFLCNLVKDLDSHNKA